jgi:outer membrane lipoprotein-sorting protein
MRVLLLIITFILMAGPDRQDDHILEKVDRNMSSKNRIIEASMTVYGKRDTRTITSRSWGEGTKKSFSEYLSPASERGTKMLKLEGQLWIYSPSTDRIIQISGNMLRQSIMGSDLSYEDMMDDRRLEDIYSEKFVRSDTLDGRKVWVIDLTAKVKDIEYYSQKMWVDTARYVPLKEEMFAKSGELLKKIDYKDIRYVQGRWFPFIFVYKDMLKEGNGTEFRINSIRFDQQIPAYIFTKAALRK